jgi:hypothetical protein
VGDVLGLDALDEEVHLRQVDGADLDRARAATTEVAAALRDEAHLRPPVGRMEHAPDGLLEDRRTGPETGPDRDDVPLAAPEVPDQRQALARALERRLDRRLDDQVTAQRARVDRPVEADRQDDAVRRLAPGIGEPGGELLPGLDLEHGLAAERHRAPGGAQGRARSGSPPVR